MQYFPNGSQFAVSAGLSAPIPITAITNADPAVATAVGVNTGDYVVVESGWGGINNRATQAGTVVDDDVPLIGLDTSEAARYPQDTFSGNLRIASNFFGLSQITELDKSGGEQQFYEWAYIDDPTSNQYRRPTRKSARGLTLNMDYDPELPWYQAMIALDVAQRQSVLRITLPTLDQLLYFCYVSFQEDPTMVVDQNMQNVASFSMTGRVTRIPAPTTP